MVKNDSFFEKSLLVIFVVINVVLYIFSYDGATLNEGADASQYYMQALSFLESGQFNDGDVPFTFGTPLYSIFLSIPIYIFGLQGSIVVIVFLQCALLYITGFLSRKILLQFSNKFGVLLHAVVIFNPKSIITAHLVQSETLFTFLFIWSVVIAFKIVTDFSLKNIVLLGVLTGLATLTRPVALYLLILWPIFILITLIIKFKQISNKYVKLLVIVLAGGLIISPWYVRNYINFGEVFLTSNSGAYLKDQYLQLKAKGSNLSLEDAQKKHKKIFKNYLGNNIDADFCLKNERHWSCNSAVTHASLEAITVEPLAVHVKALIASWGTLFMSGGASNIRNYLGLSGKDLIVNFQNKSFNGLKSILELIKNMESAYFFIFIFTVVFTVIFRIAGIIGIFYCLNNKEFRPYGVLLIEIISIFTASYLYLGQSRFRVPLEPILMLFAVIGILFVIKALGLNNKGKSSETK